MRYRAFLAYGADPNHVAVEMGTTALLLAIRAEQRGFEGKELVEMLLRAGADPSAPPRHGMTPLAETFYQLLLVLHECREQWGGNPDELQAFTASHLVDLIHLFFNLVCPKEEDDDDLSKFCSQEATYTNSVGGSFLAVTEEYLVFFEKALDAGKDVRGGFKFMNRILMLHMMLQGLAKRSGRDPQDIFSRTFYRFCIRIEEELGDEAFRID